MAFFWQSIVHDLLNVIILAVVQGLTEFLPVSSSGHLVIAQHLLGVKEPGITLEIWLHIGTLFSILFFYRSVITAVIKGLFKWERQSVLISSAVLVSMVPAVVFYFFCQDFLEGFYKYPRGTASLMIFTGVVLISLRWVRCREGELTISRAVMAGLAQALALFPGISRSGMTISAARALGISPVKAAEFSFLMVIPLLIGAASKDYWGYMRQASAVAGESSVGLLALAIGVVVSAAVGYFALKAVVRVLNDERFWMFGIYCVLAGALAVVLL